MSLYRNDHFLLDVEDNEVYIVVEKSGYEVKQFNNVLDSMPRITVNNFLNLKHALDLGNRNKVKIGFLKSEVEVFISSDNMSCDIKVNFTEQYIRENTEKVFRKIMSELQHENIIYGIEDEKLKDNIIPCKKFKVAKGIKPKQGKDAEIKYFIKSEKKVEIKSDGSTDYYNLDLIDEVKANDWVGEKILPVPGEIGYDITGEILEPDMARDEPILYDNKSIQLCIEDEKRVLRALHDGAVIFKNNKIYVQDHLTIEGDVDFSTGNINFDGYVTINGTVKDGFNVLALNDISILGEIGVGASVDITSTNGNVFVKGGINGGGISNISADRNVYIKYINEATVTAGAEINIGYYSIDSDLYADRVLIKDLNGKLVSGNVYVRSQVIAGIIGNMTERRTNIHVYGFNREKIREEYKEVLLEYKRSLIVLENLKNKLNNCNTKCNYDREFERYEEIQKKVSLLNKKRIKKQNILKAKGEGEVFVYKAMYPQTNIRLKNTRRNIQNLKRGTVYSLDESIMFEGYCKDC